MNFARTVELIRNLGPGPFSRYALRRSLRGIQTSQQPFALGSKDAMHPLWCRPGSSDMEVYHQIFARREYRCLDGVVDPGLIVDCGANVGYSAAFFLSRHPRAEVIAIEPDADNFALLQRNLFPYGKRATSMHTGVWSETTDLVMNEVPFRDAREWSRTVRAARPGEANAFKAVSIGDVIGLDRRCAILKVDIEGAEAEVFAKDVSWLDRVDNLVIELHGEEASRVVTKATDGRGFDVSTCDELTVYRRRSS